MAGVIGIPLGAYTMRQLQWMYDQVLGNQCIRHAQLMATMINLHVDKNKKVSVNDYLPKQYQVRTSADNERELDELDRKLATGEL